MPGNVELAARESGLDRDSEVNVSQIVTPDKSALSDWAATVDPATMRQIEAGMALALDLLVRRHFSQLSGHRPPTHR